MIRSFIVLCFSSLIILGCGANPTAPSDLNITNGLVIDETEYPSVVHLFRKNYVNGKRKGSSLCTGTWIAEDLILTAAHCTGDGPSDDQGRVQDLEMFVITITDHKTQPKTSQAVTVVTDAWRPKAWEKTKKSNRYDVAILRTLPRQDGEPARVVSPISQETPAVGDEITMVGFGYHNMSRFGKKGDDRKRMGFNQIDSVKNGFINTTGEVKDKSGGADGQNVSSGEGDSGGPMFLNGAIIGVASSGGTEGIFGRGSSSHVDLKTCEWFQEALKRQDLF